ncbi:hemolysin family protein [Aestuariispira ectoiniformans]|uniref:hemolysin family protein n=1 Tax=Aestuariispira ectoiniformans TaxID=2775080 RepID=UPI00223C23AB|nr:hemolysin family protein [Aestuariispira ectoiniformans]
MADAQASSGDKAEPGQSSEPPRRGGLFKNFWRGLLGRNGDSNLRDTFEEILEEHDDRETPIASDERQLLENILKVGDTTAYDVMVPRADIISIEASTPLEDVVRTMVDNPHSRYPIYRGTADDMIGMVHIKDVLRATTQSKTAFSLRRLRREVLFVAPSMRVLDLLLQMRESRRHMALVVDEYGGIDGLVTIEDLVEEIVGEIKDEYDVDAGPGVTKLSDGTLRADARFDIEDFEEQFGAFMTEEERDEDIDTLGGLVFHIAGRVPTRGEIIRHVESGVEFEIMEGDPRRIKLLRIRNLPNQM